MEKREEQEGIEKIEEINESEKPEEQEGKGRFGLFSRAWQRAAIERYEDRKMLCWALFFGVALFYMECVLRGYAAEVFFGRGLLLTALFCFSLGFFFAFLLGLLRGRAAEIVGFCLLLSAGGWILLQTVYYAVFSAFFTLYSFSGAASAAEFWPSAVSGITEAWLPLLLLLLPFGGYFLMVRFWRQGARLSLQKGVGLLLVAALLQGGALLMVYSDDDDVMSEKYLFRSTFIPSLSMEHFGALTTLRLDLKNLIFGMEDAETAAAFEAEEAARLKAERGDYPANALEIDWDALIEEEDDAAIRDMHEYFRSVTPTLQNEYTGKFAGKNLIWICAEGFSSWALNEELTPTLCKMAKECFVFENFYNPIWGVSTSDGEYTTTTGLIPKSGVWSMAKSSNNQMAFCMGNQLSAQGYLCNAYHNHSYTYYDRDRSHPNLGYSYIAKGHGLEVKTQWPESDVEMMEASVDDYINSDAPFHVYYMTVSGHLEYNFGGNAMAAKHKEEVAELPYSEACKAYLACQMELEAAVKVLLDALKEAGKLEDTLIVLSGDHYPYGLTKAQIDELNGSEVEENFELYHSTLILWNSAMAAAGETVTVEKPCYSVDILPTLSNLMGLDYDSRLLMGRDILSPASPLVVFSDHSWLTEKGRYNASTGEFIAAEGVRPDKSYVSSMMEKVNSMFTYSAKILDTDYYSHVLSQGAVSSE